MDSEPTPPRKKARIVAKPQLSAWKEQYPQAAASLQGWADLIEESHFNSFAELRQVIASVDMVNDTYLVFNIKGGDFRLITLVRWTRPTIYLRQFLTHKEYDRWSDDQRSEQAKRAAKEGGHPKKKS